MRKTSVILISLALTIAACSNSPAPENDSQDQLTNTLSNDRMLLVLSAPSVSDSYYSPAFQLIVDFQIAYAKQVMNNDNIVVIVDSETKRFYEGHLPEDILITADVYDIWMRDFSTINPLSPVQFTYTWASMTRQQSREVQGSFSELANRLNIQRANTSLLIDGGNIVDNYKGRVITTTRFLEDNNLTHAQGVSQLKELLGANEVAIIEPDEEVLAHSDGMVSWVDDNTLLINDYSNDPAFRTRVLDELNRAFPGIAIIEVPVDYTTNPPGQWDGFESACGINLNATITFNNIYVPVFGMDHEQEALRLMRQNTSKNIIEVNAEGVCAMGGSVRCLTWQLTGANAEKLILAARS
ncbi:agmatine deiminase family protein [Roseivirga sp. E12]|uniref:agmatine deiminase family protein n=1 Tax=Roseivirga sp. E12 TaxID=2819237 RepID=UPI001ABBF4A3|nr:agmatine deiminase family protein [Roseivirga sp. E12]MBO3697177.1 agmatine deiminase family protein [Roseivirga sp. E12]